MGSVTASNITMTIGEGEEAKTFPIQDVVWTRSPSCTDLAKQGAKRISWASAHSVCTGGRWITFYHRAMDPEEIAKMYSDSTNKEENVNYLFKVYVIDVKNQSLLGEISIICSDVSKATAIATMRLDLDEEALGHLKFHVEKVCVVPAQEE